MFGRLSVPENLARTALQAVFQGVSGSVPGQAPDRAKVAECRAAHSAEESQAE